MVEIALISIYIMLQLTADVTAVKIIDVFGITIPAATFIYAITFTLRDVMHKKIGKTKTQQTIIMAAICNMIMVLYFLFTLNLHSAVFWTNQEAYVVILGFVWRISLASILAEVVSELIDTEVYSILDKKPQWFKVIISNFVSIPIDSILFVLIAFYGNLPHNAIISLIIGQMLFKFSVATLSLPIIYIVKNNENTK